MSAELPSEVDAERRRILEELGRLGFTLPGTITTRPGASRIGFGRGPSAFPLV